jgi:hypothetical protein
MPAPFSKIQARWVSVLLQCHSSRQCQQQAVARSCVAAGGCRRVKRGKNSFSSRCEIFCDTFALFRTAIMYEAYPVPFGQVMGTCSHPLCTWSGKRVNYAKHKDGCGKAPNIRPGKHEGCPCCVFVPAHPAAPEQPRSVLREALAAVGPGHVSLHEHMQGEFHRSAMIEDRCACAHCVVRVGMVVNPCLGRIEFLKTQVYADGHGQFVKNRHPVETVHTR